MLAVDQGEGGDRLLMSVCKRPEVAMQARGAGLDAQEAARKPVPSEEPSLTGCSRRHGKEARGSVTI